MRLAANREWPLTWIVSYRRDVETLSKYATRRSDIQPLDPVLLDGEDEWAGQLAGRDDGAEVGHESMRHFGTCQILAREAEAPDGVAPYGVLFGWVVPHSSVLKEHDLLTLASIGQPRLVGDPFVFRYAVPFGERDEAQAGLT